MPPRRAKGARGKVSENKILTPEDEEHNKNIRLLLQDVDKTEEMLVKEMEASMESVCKSMRNLFMMSRIKIPASTKALTQDEYVEKVS
jgi:hypothetical protein